MFEILPGGFIVRFATNASPTHGTLDNSTYEKLPLSMKILFLIEDELTFKWIEVTYLTWFSAKLIIKSNSWSSQVYLRVIKRYIRLHIKTVAVYDTSP